MASATDTYVFEIRSGLYRGVTHDLGLGRHVVGSGDGSDLMLMEPSLQPQHAAIVLEGSTIRVEGLAEGVSVDGAGPVPPGAARTVRLPAQIEIGGVETVWHDRSGSTVPTASDQPGGLRALLGRPAVPGLAAAGILAVTIFLTLSNPIAGAAVLLDGSAKEALERIGVTRSAPDTANAQAAQQQAAAPSTQPAAPDTAKAAPPSGPAQQPATPASHREAKAVSAPPPARSDAEGSVEKAAASLKRQVEQAGLLNVQIGASSGAVAAAGTIEPSMASRWESLQKEFDERFVGEVALVNSVAVKAEKLPASLGIEGVWRGPLPYIVIRGQRYLVGAVVDGGWAIRGIERDRVMLEREGRLVAMRF